MKKHMEKLCIGWERENMLNTVAPYEAEWQLVQLQQQNLIDCAISEDADLVALSLQTIMIFFFF